VVSAVADKIDDQTASPPAVGVVGRSGVRTLALAWAGVAALVLLIVLAHHISSRPYGDFTRDPDAVGGEPFYVGALSLVGLVAWGTAAASAGLAAMVLWTRPPRREVLSLAFLSLFTLYLAADDAFQFHEVVFPGHLGIPQRAVYAAYLLVVGGYLVLARGVILRTEWWLLALALLAFAISIAFDLATDANGLPILGEDGAKLLGIMTWCAYITHTAFVELRRVAGQPHSSGAVAPRLAVAPHRGHTGP
jgi:hypothetical protein